MKKTGTDAARKRIWTAAALIGLLLPLAAGAKDPKTQEPFYRRFLAPGNPIDDKILEYEKKIAANPDSADLHNDFGNLLALRRFPKEAREQYEIAMKLDKHNFMAPYNMGIVYEMEGNTKSAISAYEKSVDRNRGFPPSRFRLGRLYERTGRNEAAVEQFATAFQIDPSMREVRRNPLVVDTHLIDRVAVENYPKDMARAALKSQAAWADEPKLRRLPVDRPLWSEDLTDPLNPEPVDRSGPAERSPAPAPLPAGPGQMRPQISGERPAPEAPPPPPPTEAQPAPPQPQPQDDNPLGLRPRPPLPTPIPQ
jgi:tetratricopeptide (TPR) repeat protein